MTSDILGLYSLTVAVTISDIWFYTAKRQMILKPDFELAGDVHIWKHANE